MRKKKEFVEWLSGKQLRSSTIPSTKEKEMVVEFFDSLGIKYTYTYISRFYYFQFEGPCKEFTPTILSYREIVGYYQKLQKPETIDDMIEDLERGLYYIITNVSNNEFVCVLENFPQLRKYWDFSIGLADTEIGIKKDPKPTKTFSFETFTPIYIPISYLKGLKERKVDMEEYSKGKTILFKDLKHYKETEAYLKNLGFEELWKKGVYKDSMLVSCSIAIPPYNQNSENVVSYEEFLAKWKESLKEKKEPVKQRLVSFLDGVEVELYAIQTQEGEETKLFWRNKENKCFITNLKGELENDTRTF